MDQDYGRRDQLCHEHPDYGFGDGGAASLARGSRPVLQPPIAIARVDLARCGGVDVGGGTSDTGSTAPAAVSHSMT